MHLKFEFQIIYFHPCFQYTAYVSKLMFPNDHVSNVCFVTIILPDINIEIFPTLHCSPYDGYDQSVNR